jgi:hypothetical protein
MSMPDDGLAADVNRVVQSALAAVGRAGIVSAASVAEAVEGAGRALTRRVIANALSAPRGVPDRSHLARALSERPTTPALGNATLAAIGVRVASRLRPLGFLSRRTPMWLLAAAVPALVATVARGSDELGLVASHLVQRARADGVDPQPDRVRRVAVQIVSHAPIDADVEPSNGRLVVSWLRRAVRAALPFTAGVATRDPEGLAERAAEVDAASLAAD